MKIFRHFSFCCLCLGAVLSASMPSAWAHCTDSQRHESVEHGWPEQDAVPYPPYSASDPAPSERFGPSPHWPAGPAYRGHDQAREAVQRGQALPLREVLRRLRPDYAGRVLRVQFEYDTRFEVWVYDIRMLFDESRLVRLKVDALTAEVLAVRGPRRAGKKEH
ncbi:MAG TPA: hypothetical protein PLG97_13125 [Alcaligenes sp.]|nr:hypothetical protein [Alcaligenes sp.]HRL28458.1 hypothetical protein [Alcaligenes sp.]